MDLYLEQEGFRLTASAANIDSIFRAVAAREMKEDDFATWLQAKTARIEPSP
jgi:prophage maintenance system killer protein